jgi:hypothetical protein
MRVTATHVIPGNGHLAPTRCSTELAGSALRRMKGCRVVVEGIDDCALAYLTGLSATTVEGLVRAWDPGWGFPTASRLASLKDRLDSRPAPPTAHRARNAAGRHRAGRRAAAGAAPSRSTDQD